MDLDRLCWVVPEVIPDIGALIRRFFLTILSPPPFSAALDSGAKAGETLPLSAWYRPPAHLRPAPGLQPVLRCHPTAPASRSGHTTPPIWYRTPHLISYENPNA